MHSVTAMHSSSPVLPFGAFYGQVDTRRHVDGFEVALMDVDPEGVVERHLHEEAHFVFVLAGLYVSSAVGADAISRGQTLVFNPPGTTHRDPFEARARVMEGRFLTLSLPLICSLPPPARVSRRTRRSHSAMRMQLRLLRVLHAPVRAPAIPPLFTRSHWPCRCCRPPYVRLGSARVLPHWLSVAEELLRDACDQGVRIADLAAVAGVHPVHFARVFRHFNQCTPADYLRHRRVEHAEVLLRSSARPLSEIAASCGFADQSHFSNCFRRVRGMTPGACRRIKGTELLIGSRGRSS